MNIKIYILYHPSVTIIFFLCNVGVNDVYINYSEVVIPHGYSQIICENKLNKRTQHLHFSINSIKNQANDKFKYYNLSL